MHRWLSIRRCWKQAGIATQLAVLGDAGLTETGQSPAGLLEVPGAVLAEQITIHLLREIVVRGPRGGPLFPLAAQLNADMTCLQGRRVEGRVDRLDHTLRQLLAGWTLPVR